MTTTPNPTAEAIARVRELHRPVEIEPSSTICHECSHQLPSGDYAGKVTEWPCATLDALAAGVAPQEPSEWDCSCRCSHLHHSECHEQCVPAPCSGREKLIAEMHDVKRVLRSSGQDRLADVVEQALDALAAQPILAPEKVRLVIAHSVREGMKFGDLYRIADALCEAAKRGELS